MKQLQGTAHVYGDNIDTDAIIAGKYTKTLDLQVLADHVLEDLDPDFRQKMRSGDFLVAGSNFGCGSSREQAPLALKTAGLAGVVAESFARIFFRNAVNIGLPVLEVRDFAAQTGDQLRIDLHSGKIWNLTNGLDYRSTQLPQFMVDILAAGGLANYLRHHGGYRL